MRVEPLYGDLVHKYRAKRTIWNGETYDSKAEAARACQLTLLQKAGHILSWKRGAADVMIDGPSRGRRVTYRPDFIVWGINGEQWAEDVKGFVPREFRIKAILWEQKHPDIPLRVVNQHGTEIWRLK